MVKSDRIEFRNCAEWSDLARKLTRLESERNRPGGPDWKRIQIIAKDIELLAASVLKRTDVA